MLRGRDYTQAHAALKPICLVPRYYSRIHRLKVIIFAGFIPDKRLDNVNYFDLIAFAMHKVLIAIGKYHNHQYLDGYCKHAY